jgi:hypothetical protein
MINTSSISCFGLLVEEQAKLHSCFVKLRFRSPDCTVEPSGDLFVLVPFDIVEDEYGTVPGRKLCNRSIEGDAVDDRHARRSLGSELDDVGEISVVRGRLELDSTLSKAHEHLIDRHAMEPRREGGLTSERTDLSEELDEYVLGNVLGLGGVSHHPEAEGVDSTIVFAIEALEGRDVAVGR